ncbi:MULTISPECIES: hypothetical protein [unclassified Psychrobacillus]|uniref:hypothetical protein n=1 Tax=unclassified Psychrobacillus TaxID=2636677 RepID=UPI0030FA8F15
MSNYEKRIEDERRKQFIEMYEKTFGVECQIEEIDRHNKTVLVINIWGIKSNWI